MDGVFERRLAANYADLTNKMRVAADYLVNNPVDFASRPLRALADNAGTSPATFTRLARALGYQNLDELREERRNKIGKSIENFSQRAARLQQEHGEYSEGFLHAHSLACQQNIAAFEKSVSSSDIERVVSALTRANNIYLLGALGSSGLLEHMAYLGNMCSKNWNLLGRMGASLGAGLTGIDSNDVLIVLTKPPFAPRVIKAAKTAQANGAYVTVITDTHECPALKFANVALVVPSQSPHFFSSYVTTLFLVETLISKFVSRSGEKAKQRIANVEENNRLLTETSV